ncbi:MAG: phage gp6-like head-tail connector protein [Sulfurovaceae bacterium]|nr:phage gp6-like head-tail connector protein [Sulfurovaceae bacterium]
MKTKLIQLLNNEVVSLVDAKSYYRVLGDESNVDIQMTIDAAVNKAEQMTNRQLCKATYEGYLDNFKDSKIPKPPLVSVTKVEYLNTDGERVAYTDYEVDAISVPAVISFSSTPSDYKGGKNSVIVTFECGYETVPAAIKQWIFINGLTYFENRENIVVGATVSTDNKKYTDHLLDDYRIIPV